MSFFSTINSNRTGGYFPSHKERKTSSSSTGTGDGNVGSVKFTTVQAQQAYVIPGLAGVVTADISLVMIGQTAIAEGMYAISGSGAGTTLTFSGFTVTGNKKAIVFFNT